MEKLRYLSTVMDSPTLRKTTCAERSFDGWMKQGKRAGAALDAVQEEKVILRCVDDVTDKELPWSAV